MIMSEVDAIILFKSSNTLVKLIDNEEEAAVQFYTSRTCN
jgi:hypothetical protein